MNNHKSNFKELPKNIKFATFNSNNENEILLEILIANLIHNGTTFNELLKSADKIENTKEREEMKTKVTNTVLDFINLNPEYINLLNDSDTASKFLNSLGLD